MYVFDDNESEESRCLLAQVPLLPLAQGRTSISDTYTLTQVHMYRGVCKLKISPHICSFGLNKYRVHCVVSVP